MLNVARGRVPAHLRDVASSAPPWVSSERGADRLGARAMGKLVDLVVRWGVCRGNKVAYLRRRGMRIGTHAALLNRVEDFGTEPWLIELGSRVTIATGALFVTHDGASRVFRQLVEGGSPFGNRFGTIRILDNSFIGARAIVLPGVTIGPNSIVGAGAVVTRNVAAGTVAAGMPARSVSSLGRYVDRYRARMIPELPSDRANLRRALTARLWGEER